MNALRFARLVPALAALGLLAAPALADGPAASPAEANYEIHFLTGMIDHHHMAVEMSEVCLTKAAHPELAALCAAIVAAQEAEIATMHDWLMDWYGIHHAAHSKHSDERMMEKLEALEGDAYDEGYLREMVMHHETALRHAGHCHHRAEHMELHGLCSAIQAAQEAEIEQMEQWLCDWYGDCGHM